MSRRYSCLIGLAAALAIAGCKEMEEAFEGTQDDQITRQKREREALDRAAEAGRVHQAKIAAEMAAATSNDLGAEPEDRAARVRWLVRSRVGCGSTECSQDMLQRLRALGDISAELRPVLDRDDEATRAEAIRLVGVLKVKGLELRVLAALGERSASLRIASCHTLEWLADPALAVRILKYLHVRREDRLCLLGALGATPGTVALTALSRAATGEDAVVASTAVHALEKRKGDDAIAPLEETIALSPFPDVKRAAVEALAIIGSTAAKAALGRAARSRDPAVRKFVKDTKIEQS